MAAPAAEDCFALLKQPACGLLEHCRKLATNPEAYVYLAESIRAWPDQRELADDLNAAGWERVQWRDLTGGIVAIHRGFAPKA